MAGGTMRGDQIYPRGIIKLGDIVNCFPFEDPVVVVRVTGSAILKALENGLSKLPALEGRFPHVSNIFFTYDPSLPPGSRVLSCKIGTEDVNPDKKYSVATRGYMARGKDGYGALSSEEGAEDVIDDENGILISMILHQYFLSLKVVGKWSCGGAFRKFFGGLKRSMSAKGELIQSESCKEKDKLNNDDHEDSGSECEDEDSGKATPEQTGSDDVSKEKTRNLFQKYGMKWARIAGVGKQNYPLVDWTSSISPRLEGRIKPIN
jgi:5'-nucleotidase